MYKYLMHRCTGAYKYFIMTCVAFWKHTNIRPGNKIYPCCRFKQSIGTFDGNLETLLDSEAYQELRRKDLAGEVIPECSKCHHEENNGLTSLRQRYNSNRTIDAVQLEYLEIGFDNICNLTCDACGPEFSSTWANKLDPTNKKFNIESAYIETVPPSTDELYFMGGEPLMTTRHKKFLNKIADLSKVKKITYHTNGTFLLDQETIDLLNQVNYVRFYVSIDGYGELNDQVRTGSSWPDVVKFLDQVQSLNYDVYVHTAVHTNNWHGLSDMATFIQARNCGWTANPVTWPQHLDIANLPLEVREEIKKSLPATLPDRDYFIERLGAG